MNKPPTRYSCIGAQSHPVFAKHTHIIVEKSNGNSNSSSYSARARARAVCVCVWRTLLIRLASQWYSSISTISLYIFLHVATYAYYRCAVHNIQYNKRKMQLFFSGMISQTFLCYVLLSWDIHTHTHTHTLLPERKYSRWCTFMFQLYMWSLLRSNRAKAMQWFRFRFFFLASQIKGMSEWMCVCVCACVYTFFGAIHSYVVRIQHNVFVLNFNRCSARCVCSARCCTLLSS